jgi:hypothetical protein
MIEKYKLFDPNLKPEHLNIRSNTDINPKHSIDVSMKNGKSPILAQDGFDEINAEAYVRTA